MSSELRKKLIDQMNLHGLSPQTQRSYITAVKRLATHYNQPPDELSNDQVRDYFTSLILKSNLERETCYTYLGGVLFFYRHICNRDIDDRFGLPPWPRKKKLPIVLSIEEVERLFGCIDNLKHRVFLKTIYSAGLRVSEARKLKPEHIESDPSRMLIRIEQGKGRKDRYSVLSAKLLPELREYWQKYSPQQWLFPGYKPEIPISYSAAAKIYRVGKKKQG